MCYSPFGPFTTRDASFAECNCTQQRRLCTRQSLCRVLHSAKSVGISLPDKGFFAECRISGTRQRIYQVPQRLSAKKSRRDCQVTVTAPLPSATSRHSAKKCVFCFLKNFFAECLNLALGKSCFLFFLHFLCRVP